MEYNTTSSTRLKPRNNVANNVTNNVANNVRGNGNFNYENFSMVKAKKKSKKSNKKKLKINNLKCSKVLKFIDNCPECKNMLLKKYFIEHSSAYKLQQLLKPENRETVILCLVGLIILLIVNLIFS